jgi:hypothetical protein
MERAARGMMASDSLQNICALEPGLKRSDNVSPRHHASWLEPSERVDAACIDAIRADAVLSSTGRFASTDVVSLTDGMSLTDAMSWADAMSLADGDVLETDAMSFGGRVVGGACDIEER